MCGTHLNESVLPYTHPQNVHVIAKLFYSDSQSPEAPAMWSRLAALSLADSDFRTAERCHLALGDVARARFLRALQQLSSDPRHPLVQARVAMLNRQVSVWSGCDG